MKTKLVTWYLLVSLVLGNFSETFAKPWNPYTKNGTVSLDLILVKGPTSKNHFSVQARYTRDTEKGESWQMKEIERDKELNTNVTSPENVKKQDKYQSQLSSIGDYVFGSLLLILCILALLGNGCALTIFRFRHRRLIPIEVFFINLAVVDLLLAVASYPLSIMASFMHRWNFKELGCTAYAFCCYFLGLSNIYTITAMAFTRYLITCKPVQGNQITCWKCCKMIATSYFVAFILAAMPLLGFGKYEVEPFGLSCTLDWIAKDWASRIYIILVTIVCVLIPLVILLFCYTQIIILVKQSSTLMKITGVTKRNTRGSSAQLTWISSLISTGFVIAWLPYTIACLWSSFQGEVVLPTWLSPGPVLFAKSSIVYNPFIYVFLTARYRQDFYEMVRYISCNSTDVVERKRSHYTNNVTATEEIGSTYQQIEPGNYAVGIEEHDTDGTSNINVPVTRKETYV